MTAVPWAEWLPDQSNLNSPNAEISGVLPAANSYLPLPSFQLLASALAALESKPLGGIMARSLDGTTYVFVGLAGKIMKLDTADLEWDDVSKAATTYGASELEPWDFEQWGEYVFAVNANNDPQVFQLGSSSTFDDLAGSPPRARYVRSWGDFLALMGLTSNPNRVHWSGVNDHEEWTPGTNNSDYQDFPDGGVVVGSTRATNPIIFQQRAITLGTFVPGSTAVFAFNKIHDQRGALAPFSIATRGELAFYADNGSFNQIGPDGSITPIGREKIDRTVFGMMTPADMQKIRAVVDPYHSRVYFVCDTTASGTFDLMVVYDWTLQKFAKATVDIAFLMPLATPGQTLEGLDALFPSGLESMDVSFDARIWQGGAPVLGAINSAYKLGTFTGSAMEAILTTQEMGDPAGQMTLIRTVTPMLNGSNDFYVSHGTRKLRGDPVVFGAEVAPTAETGRVDKLVVSRFHQLRVRIPAGEDWAYTEGMDVDSRQAGWR